MAAAGAAITAGAEMTAGAGEVHAEPAAPASDRCPFFDQPMYCKGLSPDGGPMCEK